MQRETKISPEQLGRRAMAGTLERSPRNWRKSMKAADVMTRTVITTTAEASIEEVARLMVLHRFSGVPVVDAQGSVIGMITEGDLMRRAEIDTEKPHSQWV